MFCAKIILGCNCLILCAFIVVAGNATPAICASNCTGGEKICTISPSVQQSMLF